jgi:hypothetical protein
LNNGLRALLILWAIRVIAVVTDLDTALIVDLTAAGMIGTAVLFARVAPADPLAVTELCSASACVALDGGAARREDAARTARGIDGETDIEVLAALRARAGLFDASVALRPARRAVAVGSRARRACATKTLFVAVTERAELLRRLTRLAAATEPAGLFAAVGLDTEDGAANKDACIIVVAAEGDLVGGHL